MKIDVTQEDIEKGRPVSCDSCPVALAISRYVGASLFVDVTLEDITFSSTFRRLTTLNTPAAAAGFIRAFDNKKPTCTPFSFDLDIPAELLKGGAA